LKEKITQGRNIKWLSTKRNKEADLKGKLLLNNGGTQMKNKNQLRTRYLL